MIPENSGRHEEQDHVNLPFENSITYHLTTSQSSSPSHMMQKWREQEKHSFLKRQFDLVICLFKTTLFPLQFLQDNFNILLQNLTPVYAFQADFVGSEKGIITSFNPIKTIGIGGVRFPKWHCPQVHRAG